MAKQILKVLALCLLVAVAFAEPLSSTLTTPVIVERDGYPLENHTVKTPDGYILTMHRIPYSPKLINRGTQRRPVAFLMHGLLCASSVWVLNGPGKALAYILSDEGYDVWMGNARGTVYSRKHVYLSPLRQAFWNFEWNEIGIYDLPAMIDYSLQASGEQQVRYFGHSQGTTVFFVLNSENPGYTSRIRSAHLLAPVAYFSNSPNALITTLAPVFGQPNPNVEVLGSVEFLPSTRVGQLIGSLACRDGAPTQGLCASLLFLAFGGASPFLNATQLPEITGIIPSGSSINQLLHLLQLKNSAAFRKFDYGPQRNLQEYGRITPPDYNLQNLDVPTYLYYSDNDILADPADVNRLILALRGTTALKGAYRVPEPLFNHIDFLFGLGVEDLVYNVALNDIANS